MKNDGLKTRIGAFILCILLHMVLPLVPLVIELILTQDVSHQSLTIAAAMYSISIGLSSRSRVLFAFTLIVSILLSAAYGFVVVHHHADGMTSEKLITQEQVVADRLKVYSGWVILSVFALHLFERFTRHVIKKEPYWTFEDEGQEAA